MPYVIDRKCSGNDSACLDICPVDCIYRNKNAAGASSSLYISAEECTNCGACAMACPEAAISPMVDFGRYQHTDAKLVGSRKVKVRVRPGDGLTVEIPVDAVVLNGKLETMASLMARMTD